MKRWIERAFLDEQHVLRTVFDRFSNGVTVRWA
jgi:hypothetical protein